MTDMGQFEQYIYFAQANLWKSNNASNELGLFINKVLKYYRYFDDEKAGLVINGRPGMDENYKNRLKNVGILVDDNGDVVSRPDNQDRQQYRAANRQGGPGQAFIRAMAQNPGQQSSPAWGQQTAATPETQGGQGSGPCAFVCGIQEPFYKYKKIPGLNGHVLLIDNTVEKPRAAIFHSRNLNIWPVDEFTGQDICTGMLSTVHHKKIYSTWQ